MLGNFWNISSSSSTNPGNQKFTWSLPCRIHEDEIYGTLQEKALWDPAEWEEPELKADLKDSIEQFDAGMGTLSGCNTKLSVREQARQFEQQALADRTSRDSRASLDLDDLLAIMEPQYSPGFLGKDNPPCIHIAGTTPPPPPTQRPTPPVLRRFSSSISSHVTLEPCEIWLEIIPDALDSPPPKHTFPLSHIVHSLPPAPDALSPTFTSESTIPSPLSPTQHIIPKLHPVFSETTPSPGILECQGQKKEHKGILKYNDTRKGKTRSYSYSDRNYKTGEIKAKSLIRTESESELEDFDTSREDFSSHLDSKSNSSNPSPDSEQQSERDLP